MSDKCSQCNSKNLTKAVGGPAGGKGCPVAICNDCGAYNWDSESSNCKSWGVGERGNGGDKKLPA